MAKNTRHHHRHQHHGVGLLCGRPRPHSQAVVHRCAVYRTLLETVNEPTALKTVGCNKWCRAAIRTPSTSATSCGSPVHASALLIWKRKCWCCNGGTSSRYPEAATLRRRVAGLGLNYFACVFTCMYVAACGRATLSKVHMQCPRHDYRGRSILT